MRTWPSLSPWPQWMRRAFIAVLLLLALLLLSGCGTKLPVMVIDEPEAAPVRASCLHNPPELSRIDPDTWAAMSEVERARAILRMRTTDAAAYQELRRNYLDCTR